MIDTTLAIGLNRETSPLNQKDGYYTYAENIVTDKDNKGSVANERDRIPYISIEGDIMGSCFISPTEQVLFTNKDYIYLLNTQNNNLTSYRITGADFNYPIVAESRVVNGCERIVYFVDGVNPRRFFNFDNVSDFKTNGRFDLEKFKFNRTFTPPIIKTKILTSGGSLRYGVYNFVVQYLDETENILYTSPVDIEYTPISDSSNRGALNIDTNDASAGGKPESGKAITITVEDTGNAEYARLVVLRTTTSDGFTADAHVIGEIISIDTNQKSFTYTYRGFSVDNGDYFIDKNEVLVDKAIYKTAVAQEQVQDRLLQANLTEETLDYYDLQAYANRVKVKWVAKKEKLEDIRTRTRLGGDKKALGIVYVMEDGSFSPVYLLQPQAVDGDSVTEVAYQFALKVILKEHVLPEEGYQNWDGWYRITYQIGGGSTKVFQGEFKRTVTGPNAVIVADEQLITIASQQITVLNFEFNNRYIDYIFDVTTYKENVPSIDEIPINGFDYSGNTGVFESSQKYEQPVNADCKKDRYWVELDDSNVYYHVLPDRSQIPLIDGEYGYNLGFHFSNVIYPDGIIGHFFVETMVSDIEAKGILTPFEDADKTNKRGSYFHYYDGERPQASSKYGNLISPDFLYTRSYVSGNRVKTEGVWSYSFSEERGGVVFNGKDLPYNVLEVEMRKYTPESFISGRERDFMISNSYILHASSKLNALKNQSKTNPFNIFEFEEEVPFGLQTLLRYVTVYNETNPLSNIYSLRFRRVTEFNENVSFAGDAFIAPIELTNVVETSYDTKFLAKDEIYIDGEILNRLYVESKINTKLLHDGTNICDKHYPSNTSDKAEFLEKVATEDDQGKWMLKEPICPLWTGYNKDYSRISDFNIYTLLARTYNYCSDCIGSYPNRIIYSERSFQERKQDYYRIFKANNYVDLPANKGSIQALDYKNGQLWVRTQYSCFVITPNPQQLALEGTTVEIGTGDFLSMQEQELNAVDIGFGGQLHPHESINTEHGLIWVDRSRGKILMVSDKLNEISRQGMYDFFFDNLQIQDHIRLGYDPVYERLLLTNLEKGITISYCFEMQSWKSFHSYTPSYYLYDKNIMYSFENSEDLIYGHNSENYLNSIAEVFVKDSNPFTLQSVSYYAKHFNNDGSLSNETFDEIMLYNHNQCSGYKKVQLIDRPVINYSAQIANVLKKNNLFKVSPVRDIAIGTPVLNEQQEANVDVNLPQSLHKKFNDKWLAIRLVDKSGKKYTLDYVQTLKYFIEVNELVSKNQF